MALIPQRTTVPRGTIGTWANMEEDNARTMFAGSEFAAAVPLALGATEMTAVPLTTGNRFIGIALANNTMYGTPLADGTPTYAEGDLLGVADMGTVFVLAGEDVTEGAVPFYDPATRKYHGTTAAGRLPLPNCEFDESAAEGEPVALRIRVVPGTSDVTAAE